MVLNQHKPVLCIENDVLTCKQSCVFVLSMFLVQIQHYINSAEMDDSKYY